MTMESVKRAAPEFVTVTELPNEEFRQYWEGSVGEEEIKRKLLACMKKQLSLSFFKWRRRYNIAKSIPSKGRVLFVGPSGTGKTITAKGCADYFARTYHIQMYFVELESVRSKYDGESSKNIERAFDYIESLSQEYPVVLFIDEFDSVGVSRDTEQMHDNTRAMVNTLIRKMNQLNSNRIFTIAASNLEKHVDHAVKRRFDLILYFKRPDEEGRFLLFKHYLQGWDFAEYAMRLLARRAEGYTQDDIARSVTLAELAAFLEDRRLVPSDLVDAMKEIKATGEYA